MSNTGKQPIKIHILPNISRSKVNKTIQFGQMINIFLEKPYTKCDGESNLRPFSKKSKLSICLDQQSKVLYSLFLLYAELSAMEIYWN